MASFDLNKITTSVAQILSEYLFDFIGLVFHPKFTISRLLINNPKTIFKSDQEKRSIQHCLTYTLISIIIGISLAKLLELPKTPNAILSSTLIGILFIWIFMSLIAHILVRAFGGKGSLINTIIVFLYIVSTLHLIWVPVAKLIGNIASETKITLTYEYVIYFSGHPNEGGYIPHYVESFIKERSPDKYGTIQPPAQVHRSEHSHRYPKRNFMEKTNQYVYADRIPFDKSPFSKPQKDEKPVIKSEWEFKIILISILYYLTIAIYLSRGLSVFHGISTTKLFVFAIFAHILIGLSIASITIVYFLIMLSIK